jgi:hypothetical protein
LEQLHAHLAGKQILLKLDNFEQLLEASPILSALLQGTRVKFLITSRETLNIQARSAVCAGWACPVPKKAKRHMVNWG